MPQFRFPDGETVTTTSTEYSTQLRQYFDAHGHAIIDAGRGNPGGYPASVKGIVAGIEHLEARRRASTGYGYSGGEYPESPRIAQNLNRLYGTKNFVDEKGLFYTTGEIEALNTIARSLPADSRVITPYPHYVNYPGIFSGEHGKARLLPMPHDGTNLVKRLRNTLEHAPSASAILICDPNNPTGTKLSAQEWRDIFALVQTEREHHPSLKFILDFAYYGLSNDWQEVDGKKKLAVEPLKILQDEYLAIKENVILLQSLTKVGGLFDERPCVSYIADASFRKHMLQHRTEGTFEPAATSVSIVSGVLEDLVTTDRLAAMSKYYGERAKMIEGTLSELGMLTKPWQGSLYVTADLKGLYGSKLSAEAAKWVGHNTIQNDFDIMAGLAYPADKSKTGILTSLVDPIKGDTELVRVCVGIQDLNDVKKLQETLNSLAPELGRDRQSFDSNEDVEELVVDAVRRERVSESTCTVLQGKYREFDSFQALRRR